MVRALGPAASEVLPLLAGAPDPAGLVRTLRHGTLVVHAAAGGVRRRVLEVDRGGTVVAVLRWSAASLEAAWLRIPDGRWLGIEPRAASHPALGPSDALHLGDAPGSIGEPVSVFEALDYTAVDRIPTLAEPGLMPQAAGEVVLNLLAALALDQGRERLAYRGPYPGEQLFLALLESFRHEGAGADPLAAFVAGVSTWRPHPHERAFEPGGVYVQLRERVEKVVWRGRVYHRAEIGGVARHAPRRLRDAAQGVRCSLWALGGLVEDHLELTGDGAVVRDWTPAHAAQAPRALPVAVVAGVGAVVAARSAPALAPFVREEAATLRLTWAVVRGDLLEMTRDEARLSMRLGERVAFEAAAADTPASRAGVGLAAVAEIAVLVGDALRARAQARVSALPVADQAAVLAAPPAPVGSADARIITAAVEALLEDVLTTARARPSTR